MADGRINDYNWRLSGLPDIRPCIVCGQGVLCDEGYLQDVRVVHKGCAGVMVCQLCTEVIEEPEDRAPVRPLIAHRECALRETQGGIGHHLDHDYWCVQMHDPDAGLTYRESARRVWDLFEGVL